MADLAQRPPTAIELIQSEIPDKSRTRQYLRYATYKTREHEKVELIGSSLFALLFGLFFGGGTWGATTGYTALTFVSILAFIFLWHWIHAPGAFHEHWQAKAKHLPDTDSQTKRNEALADRLRALLREAGELDGGSAAIGTQEGMDQLLRWSGHHTRVLNCLKTHRPDSVKRFEEKGILVLEELLAEVLSDDENPEPKPDIAYPKLEIEIQRTAFDFVDDHRIGALNYPPLHEECYVTLFLKIKNPRLIPIVIQTFKLILLVEGREFISFAETSVFNYRFVSLEGIEAGDGSHNKNLNERPPLVLVDDRLVEGTLQFVFKELQYMNLLTAGTGLKKAPFTLLLIDRDREQHPAEGVLIGEGNRYVNP